MPIAFIIDIPPGPEGLHQWSWDHRVDHQEITQAIQKQKNILLTDYIIDPIDENNLDDWFTRHQQLHLEMTAAVNVESVDLEDVDWKKKLERDAWLWQNWTEHQTVRRILGI